MKEIQQVTMKWVELRLWFNKKYGMKPDINAFLFLIGINELGYQKESWTKEEKQDLMHIALCKILEPEGYFKLVGKDDEGWPHYAALKTVPKQDIKEQESFLKERIVNYFEEIPKI